MLFDDGKRVDFDVRDELLMDLDWWLSIWRRDGREDEAKWAVAYFKRIGSDCESATLSHIRLLQVASFGEFKRSRFGCVFGKRADCSLSRADSSKCLLDICCGLRHQQ